jgi:hypothetical protein
MKMIVRFAVLFGVTFGVLLWLFDGDGPVPAFNEAIGSGFWTSRTCRWRRRRAWGS